MTLHKSAERRKIFLFTFLLALIIIIFYYPLLDAWFLGDDTQWMWFSAVNPLYNIFFDSGTYLYINDANFTPMLGASFKMDWMMFKMNPAGYNIHSLVSLLASSVMLYMLARLFTGVQIASSAVLLFIVNPATVAVISCFSNRHYIEGIFWALLSFYLFFRYNREGKPVFIFFSSLAYLLAALSKEVYLLLPALMFILIQGDILKRVKTTLPFLMIFLVYLPWRWLMLGGSLGGYYFIDWSIQELFSNGLMAVGLPIQYVYGKFWLVFPFAILIILIFMLTTKEGRIKYSKASVTYLVALLPIIPVMAIFLPSGPAGGRYAFHVSTLLIILCSFAYHSMKNVKAFRILLVLLFFCTLIAFCKQSIHVRDAFVADRKISKEETLKFLADEPYLCGVYPPWFYDGLSKMYSTFFGRQIRTRIFYEDALKYNDDDVIEEIKGKDAIPYIQAQKRMKSGPLDIDINWNGRLVKWQLGPQRVKFYHLLLRKEKELYYLYPPVQNNGRHFFAKGFADNENVYIRIFYSLPDDREVVSPEVRIFIPANGHYNYRSE